MLMKPVLFIFCYIFLFSTSNAQDNALEQNHPKPFILGHIEEIDSRQLSEKRVLNIYLPEGYDRSDTTRYPVIYLLDGSADEDFIHVVGLVQFYTFPWVNKLPKSIVVGIANVDRRRDFTFPSTIKEEREANKTAGNSDKFISFIREELQPFINKQYRTTAAATLIGQSLGGLLATEILLKHPQMFTNYIIISPSLWWDNASLLNSNYERLHTISTRTQVYIGVGKEGLTPGKFPRVMEADANYLAEKIKKIKNAHVKVCFDYLPKEDHGNIAHQAIMNAIRFLYP